MKKESKFKLNQVVLAALFAALTTVLTYYVKIPSVNGYMHIGDSMIYLCASILPTPLAALSAGIGAALPTLWAATQCTSFRPLLSRHFWFSALRIRPRSFFARETLSPFSLQPQSQWSVIISQRLLSLHFPHRSDSRNIFSAFRHGSVHLTLSPATLFRQARAEYFILYFPPHLTR